MKIFPEVLMSHQNKNVRKRKKRIAQNRAFQKRIDAQSFDEISPLIASNILCVTHSEYAVVTIKCVLI